MDGIFERNNVCPKSFSKSREILASCVKQQVRRLVSALVENRKACKLQVYFEHLVAATHNTRASCRHLKSWQNEDTEVIATIATTTPLNSELASILLPGVTLCCPQALAAVAAAFSRSLAGRSPWEF